MCCVVVGQTTEQSKSTLIYGLILQGEASDQQDHVLMEKLKG